MSNTLQEIKCKIFAEERIPEILEALECECIHLESRGERYVAQLPPRFNSRNRRSVQVRNNEYLSSTVRSRNITGDIYALVGYILYDYQSFDEVREHIGELKSWLCETLGYHQFLGFSTNIEVVEKDWNAWLRPIQKQRTKDIYIQENEVLPDNIMEQFINYPHIKWIEEGISINTQRKFHVAVDIESERIVFPVHNKEGRIIGVKGRYFGSDEITMQDYKYMPIYAYSKSVELFNLSRAYPHIKEKNEVIVVEAAKSCMLLTQWGYDNCVSIEGKDISSVQIRMLKDLRVPITFAWDKDVDKEFITRHTKDLRSKLVYAVYDTKGLLSEKDAPIDKGQKTWEILYSTRFRVF